MSQDSSNVVHLNNNNTDEENLLNDRKLYRVWVEYGVKVQTFQYVLADNERDAELRLSKEMNHGGIGEALYQELEDSFNEHIDDEGELLGVNKARYVGHIPEEGAHIWDSHTGCMYVLERGPDGELKAVY